MKTAAFLVFGLSLAFAVLSGFLPNPFEKEPDLTGLPEEGVVLYSTSWCGYCQQIKQLMDNNSISYTEYDIESSNLGRKQYKQINGRGVPVMLIDGKILRGYNPKAVLRLAKK